MTDSTPVLPPDLPPEELASAYVDGELSADARRAVESDPRLMAMVAAHRAARDAVADPVPELADEQREHIVAAALAALPAVAPPVLQGEGQVVELAAARRARTHRLVQVAAGGIAALAAAGVLALVITRNDPGHTGDTSDQLTQAADSAAKPADVTAAAAAADLGTDSGSGGSAGDQSGRSAVTVTTAAARAAEASTPSEPPALPGPAGVAPEAALSGLADLGLLADRAELLTAARRFAAVAPPTGPGVCPPYPAPLATATFQGTPAYLVVVEASAAGNRVALVDAATCAVLVKVDLAEP